MTLRIGFIGLGNMGVHIANNLGLYASSQQPPLAPLTIWNRSHEKYQLVKECNPSAHIPAENSGPEAVSARCNVVFTCLLNDAVALEVYDRLIQGASANNGCIFVDHSSLSPKTVATIEEKMKKKKGTIYLCCPLFGPPSAAKSAQLLVVISGMAKAKDLIKPILVPSVGKKVIDAGEDSSSGATLKLLGNTCILGTIELLGEVFCLADAVNFDDKLLYEFIKSWFPAAAWLNYGQKISSGIFDGSQGFRIDGGIKDGNNILSLGEDFGHPWAVPTIVQAVKNLQRAKQIAGKDLDWSSLAISLRENAGLSPFKSKNK